MSGYGAYALEVGADARARVRFEHRDVEILKVHFWAFRVPSRRKFIVRHFQDATLEDRIEALRLASRLHTAFEGWEQSGKTSKRRRSDGTYCVRAAAGHFIDDPLDRLELEMMLETTGQNELR